MKLASVRRDRDFSMVLALVGFLFLTAVATSFHYSTAFYIVAFLFAAWPVLVKWALWRDLASAPEEWLRDPQAVALPGWKATALSVLAAGALSAPIFFILPRLKAPYVKGVGAESREVTTGISDTVNPEVFGTLKQSEEVFMRVTADGGLVTPDGEAIRIRAIAF